MARLADCHERP